VTKVALVLSLMQQASEPACPQRFASNSWLVGKSQVIQERRLRRLQCRITRYRPHFLLAACGESQKFGFVT
jgi:hypothetical protein